MTIYVQVPSMRSLLGFYGLMNATHLRNRIVFHCSRCSVEHLWLMSSYLNISCKHQKLFVCFNVPSHPITQWRWKIEMQCCLAKRFLSPPSSLCFPWCIYVWCLISMQWDAEIPLLNILFLSACLDLCKEARATWGSGAACLRCWTISPLLPHVRIQSIVVSGMQCHGTQLPIFQLFTSGKNKYQR